MRRYTSISGKDHPENLAGEKLNGSEANRDG
jgi:hypothetical protein